MLKKISISPESTNYDDNADNVAYLYTAKSGNRYFIWKETREYVGDRGGSRDGWHVGQARFVQPDTDLGEDFEPYWDDCGILTSREFESRRDCIAVVDGLEAAASNS